MKVEDKPSMLALSIIRRLAPDSSRIEIGPNSDGMVMLNSARQRDDVRHAVIDEEGYTLGVGSTPKIAADSAATYLFKRMCDRYDRDADRLGRLDRALSVIASNGVEP